MITTTLMVLPNLKGEALRAEVMQWLKLAHHPNYLNHEEEAAEKMSRSLESLQELYPKFAWSLEPITGTNFEGNFASFHAREVVRFVTDSYQKIPQEQFDALKTAIATLRDHDAFVHVHRYK